IVSISPPTPVGSRRVTLRVDSPSYTGLTSGLDTINDIVLEAAATTNFAGGGGAFATQRNVVVIPGSYTANAAQTITTAATFAIEGAPTAGTNITIPNNYALWIQAGASEFDGVVSIAPAARTSGSPNFYARVLTPADTTLAAGGESRGIQFGGD